MTKYPDLFNALAAEFRPNEVKVRSQAGRQFQYVTARTVANRLDEVLGPENWWDDYTPLEHSVICRLSIRLPDGQVVTKCDAGGEAGMSDPGDNDKSGFSDAFKRTAVKFGVGRYLYRDGVAQLAAPVAAVLQAAQAPAPVAKSNGTAKKETVETGAQLYAFAQRCRIDTRLVDWILSQFTHYPKKINTWSKIQVTAALPIIRKHLEEVMASRKENVLE